MSKETQTFRIRELDPDIIAPSTKNMNRPEQGGSKIVIIGKPGCFTKDTPILMFDGSIKKVQDVCVGDGIMGDDSTLRNVLELCQGFETMYKISPKEGEPYIVNERHKLVLKDKKNNIIEMTVKDYLSLPLHDYFIYRNSVEFKEQPVAEKSFDMGKKIAIGKIDNIPNEYIINSRQNRIDFLKGFFEENGPFYDHLKDEIRSQIDFMRKSLGLFYDESHTTFTVENMGEGEYFGFTLDGNHRFLLGSFDVVRNTGKTTLITSLLYEKSHIFPVGQVMSGTEDSNGHYGKIFPSSFVYNALDKPQIENFVKRQKVAKLHLPNPWAVLLLDDCTDDPKLFNEPLFQGIFKNGRHWKMLFILSLQYSLDIKPVIRTNVDGTFILREAILKNRKNLWENYAGVFPDFSQFCEVLDQMTDDYTALYIHNATTSNKIEDCVFWYKAKPVPPNFRIGSDEYWAYHDERYNKDIDKADHI
jgi:hypothetical protein